METILKERQDVTMVKRNNFVEVLLMAGLALDHQEARNLLSWGVEIDGEIFKTSDVEQCYKLYLPPGKHTIKVVGRSAVKMEIPGSTKEELWWQESKEHLKECTWPLDQCNRCWALIKFMKGDEQLLFEPADVVEILKNEMGAFVLNVMQDGELYLARNYMEKLLLLGCIDDDGIFDFEGNNVCFGVNEWGDASRNEQVVLEFVLRANIVEQITEYTTNWAWHQFPENVIRFAFGAHDLLTSEDVDWICELAKRNDVSGIGWETALKMAKELILCSGADGQNGEVYGEDEEGRSIEILPVDDYAILIARTITHSASEHIHYWSEVKILEIDTREVIAENAKDYVQSE